MLRSVGLDVTPVVANDPFFGRGGRMMAATPEGAGPQVRVGGRRWRPREADGRRLVQLPPRPLRPGVRDPDRRRRGRPTRPASASAWSGSPWRCSASTGSTRGAGRRASDVELDDPATTMMEASPRPRPGHLPAAPDPRRGPARGPRRTATSTSGSSCCTPGASTRSPSCRSPWRSTSRATSGRSSSPRTATCATCTGSTSRSWPIWRPLVEHVEEQVELGRPVLVELDSFHLPDTAGTAYRTRARQVDDRGRSPSTARRGGWATSTTRAIHELEGEDFASVFRLTGPPTRRVLPPYVEFVKRRPARPRPATS